MGGWGVGNGGGGGRGAARGVEQGGGGDPLPGHVTNESPLSGAVYIPDSGEVQFT